LGNISRDVRIGKEKGIAAAYSDKSQASFRYINPEDEKWDIVVGTVDRAVTKTTQEKSQRIAPGNNSEAPKYEGEKLKPNCGWTPQSYRGRFLSA
jgi:hypothetical protein